MKKYMWLLMFTAVAYIKVVFSCIFIIYKIQRNEMRFKKRAITTLILMGLWDVEHTNNDEKALSIRHKTCVSIKNLAGEVEKPSTLNAIKIISDYFAILFSKIPFGCTKGDNT